MKQRNDRDNLKWIFRRVPTPCLVLLMILFFPVYMLLSALQGVVEGWTDYRYEFRHIRNLPPVNRNHESVRTTDTKADRPKTR